MSFETSPPRIALSDDSTKFRYVALCNLLFDKTVCQKGSGELSMGVSGHLVGIEPESLLERLTGVGGVGRVIRTSHPSPLRKNDDWQWLVTNNRNLVCWMVHNPQAKSFSLSFTTTDEFVFEEIRKLLVKYVVAPPKRGRTYVLASGSFGPHLQELGVVGEDLLEDNYSPKVVAGIKHVIADLNKANPCGRVAILDGVPGTGKTRAIRAIMNGVTKATFILVPSRLAPQLGEPTFITVLLQNRIPGEPMVLLLEDADNCLVTRKADNESDISALLNFGDGILGSQLDLRIIATTNRRLEDLDEAATRPRRLCRRIEVGRLDHVQATRVYKRLGGAGDPFTSGFHTLAEVYAAAHPRERDEAEDDAFKPAPKGKVGFVPASIKARIDNLIERADKLTPMVEQVERETEAELAEIDRSEAEMEAEVDRVLKEGWGLVDRLRNTQAADEGEPFPDDPTPVRTADLPDPLPDDE